MKTSFREIFEQVKENHEKLKSCNRHDFSKDLTPDKKVNKEWECTNCGGSVDSSAKTWYERGLVHGLK